MKDYLFLFAFVIFSLTSFGQLDKKTWLVGGNGRFQSYTVKDRLPFGYNNGKYKEINLSLNTGYFLIDKLAFGLRGSYDRFKADFDSADGKSNAHRFLFGPFIRYYFLEKEKTFNILMDCSYQIGSFINFGEKTSNVNAFSIMGGAELFFNSTVGMEVLLGYYDNTEKFSDGNKRKRGFQISIGFQLHLINHQRSMHAVHF